MTSTKTELLDKAVERVWERLSEDQAPQVEEFVRQYYGWVATEDLTGLSPIDIYGAAVAHWNFALQREPGTPKLRVYNPRFEKYRWQTTHTVVEIVNDDMPFLVDSVRMEINRQGYSIHRMIHPVMNVRRDEEGRLTEVLPPDAEKEDASPESVIHVEVDRHTETEALEQLCDGLQKVLDNVRVAVEDWPKMREEVADIVSNLDAASLPVEEEDVSEVKDFLQWLENNHFTLLGYREYDLLEENGDDVLRAVSDSGLGILREKESGEASSSFNKLPPEARSLARERRLLNLTKANSRSTVHRPSQLDYVGVKKFNDSGEVVGERRFLGLYTFSAYSESTLEIPILRRKVKYCLNEAGFPEDSHNEKDLVEILETFPRDEMFQIRKQELLEISTGILHLHERQRVRLFVRPDAYGRFLSCLVYVPRDHYNTKIRERMQKILKESFKGTGVEFNVRLSESVLARLHFVIRTTPDDLPDYDVAEVEEHLAHSIRSWADELYDALVEHCGEERGTELYHRYQEAFPPGYRHDYLPRTAVSDIDKIEELASEDQLGMNLYQPLEVPENFLRFKLYRSGGKIPLSSVMPLLEEMGVRVVDEHPYKIEPSDSPEAWIHNFGLAHEAQGDLQTDEVKKTFQEAFDRMWRGDVENDGFNRLVLRAGLAWREITILRAYCKYLRQAGTTFSQDYMEDTLADNAHITGLLAELFLVRLDPESQEKAEDETERLKEEIEESLDEVASLDEDRILRRFLNAILATLRTNYFQKDVNGESKPYLSFKLDPSGIPELPLPRPMFEVFVYSPRTEGVHLRGSEVARGGIRWSDRKEDFRTEILGLMKAQTVKNAVIVPMGAKGGFVVKRPPQNGDREAFQEEGIVCYRTLICGMLDLTDNLVDGETVPPPDVVRYDDDDPYLVVAADKGTATFSDIANGISKEEYGFWLGDAFASGGETGYDHKAMGITARGAWESVKRHFRGLGKDIQNEEFTVVGIGDMSGDVFGNGMLLSRHIKLVAAFNHLHIFFDPDPDPEKSFEERQRLFNAERSAWTDYDKDCISEGGGIFSRTKKSIKLTPEIQDLLGVEKKSLTPNEIIHALLKAPVDLLWNGGIGTYAKASYESNADVGDKANDSLRVDGNELGCRVIGEGGNLGFTQEGRIEFALNGGRVYMDAIDNSAGVDCSDHEVNIKILLDAVVENGDMTEKQRNELLAEMTEEVGNLVLRNNYAQTQAVDNAVAQASSMENVHARYMRALEDAGQLNRELEFLPSEEELADRRSEGLGLAAPELAILLSYTKIILYQQLLDSDVPDDSYLSRELESYFPTPLRERFREPLKDHRLRRQIIATHLTNDLVNRCGTTFAYRLREESGGTAPEIARSYAAAREIFDLRSLWSQIEALDNQVKTEVQTNMLLDARKLIERATRWLLRNQRSPLDIADAVSNFSEGAEELTELIPELMLESDRDALENATEECVEAGVPEDLAKRVATLNSMFSALDIVDIASSTGHSLETVAAVYFMLGERLRIHWLRDHIEDLPRNNRWQMLSRAALRDDLFDQEATLTAEVLHEVPDGDISAEDRVEAWIESKGEPVDRLLQVLRDVNSSGTFDLSTLSVALRETRNLTNGPEPVSAAPEKATSSG